MDYDTFYKIARKYHFDSREQIAPQEELDNSFAQSVKLRMKTLCDDNDYHEDPRYLLVKDDNGKYKIEAQWLKEWGNIIELSDDDIKFICYMGFDAYFRRRYLFSLYESAETDFLRYYNKIEFKTRVYHDISRVNGWIDSRIEEFEKEEENKRKERIEKYGFNTKNKHHRDNNIIFWSYKHIYEVNGIILDSVTTFVNNAFPKFDSEFHAKRKAKELGISVKEVLEMWEKKGQENRDLGTNMHSKIENYYLGNDSAETDAYKLFKIFANKFELKPYRTEWPVYDWEHKIAGTIDFVDYQNGEYIIYDWKRSEKIIENGMPVKINKYGEKGNYPLEHLDNTPYYHYALQLSLYKYILEKNYGMKISDLRLGIFHPTYNKPYVLRMPYLEKEINDIFKLRSEVIF